MSTAWNARSTTLPGLALEMSRRHTGVGSDGIIAILPSEKADCRMRIFNADGSEAQMCGNGIRCVAKYIYDNNIVAKRRLTIETLSGLKTVEIHAGIDGLTDMVTVDMGLPCMVPAEVPVRHDGADMIEVPVAVSGGEVRLTAVSMGNPHGVLFVDNFNDGIVGTLGRELETHPIWPEKRQHRVCACGQRRHAFHEGVGARCRRDDGLRHGSVRGGCGGCGHRPRTLAYDGEAHRWQPSDRPRRGHGPYSYDRSGGHRLFWHLLPLPNKI